MLIKLIAAMSLPRLGWDRREHRVPACAYWCEGTIAQPFGRGDVRSGVCGPAELASC